MSCVSFGGRGWLERLRAAADDPRPVAEFLSPQASEAKVRRVRLLATSADPRIRESAALSYLAPAQVLTDLADDPETGVRCCVARNERTPSDVLDRLASDDLATVRGWVAANRSVAPATLERLADDEDSLVRQLVAWANRW